MEMCSVWVCSLRYPTCSSISSVWRARDVRLRSDMLTPRRPWATCPHRSTQLIFQIFQCPHCSPTWPMSRRGCLLFSRQCQCQFCSLLRSLSAPQLFRLPGSSVLISLWWCSSSVLCSSWLPSTACLSVLCQKLVAPRSTSRLTFTSIRLSGFLMRQCHVSHQVGNSRRGELLSPLY